LRRSTTNVSALGSKAEVMPLIALIEEIDALAERVDGGERLTDAEWLRLIALWEAMKISLEAGKDGSAVTACDD
jgi:hypothetical protein